MNYNENFYRSVKGIIYNSLMVNKYPLFLTIFISLGTVVVNNLVYVFMILSPTNNRVYDNEGILGIGFLVALVVLVVSTFISVRDKELGKIFLFPVNRYVYAIGKYLAMVTISLLFMACISVIGFSEVLIGKLIDAKSTYFILTNLITIKNFSVGLWLAFSYLMFAMSLTYVIAMFFYRYKINTAIFCSLLLISILTFARNTFVNIVNFILMEQSVINLSLKLWIFILIFHVLAYIPLKAMEVKR